MTQLPECLVKYRLAPIGILQCIYIITHEFIVNLLNKSTDLFGWTSINFLPVYWKMSLTEDRNYSSYYDVNNYILECIIHHLPFL